ncbi:MAG: polymorphic outer membrane protein, partial [uncultured bacterium]
PYIQDSAGLAIDGSNQSITINGPDTGQIFYIETNVLLTLNSLFLNAGYIFNNGTLSLINTSGITFIDGNGISNISDCSYSSSGAYYPGSVSFTNCTFDNSSITSMGYVTVNNSTFNNNSNIYSENSLIINDSQLTESTIYSNNPISINNSNFTHSNNGGFYCGGSVSLLDSSFVSNGKTGIYSGGDISIINTQISSGGSLSDYPTIYSEGFLILSTSQIEFVSEGGFYSEGLATISNSSVTSGDMGFIHSMGSLIIDNSDFFFNDGFIRSSLNAQITGSNFNKVRIQNPNTVYITGESSIDSGTYLGEGEGNLIIENNSSLLVSNSNLNYCGEITNNGTFNSINNTFVQCNISSVSSFYLQNSILANDSQCHGAVTDAKNNLLELTGSYACNIHNGENSNIVGSQANLKKYSDSILSYSSPAINRGDPAICAAAPINNTSQNGLIRPQGSRCDIGSYEAPPPPIIDNRVTASNCTNDNCIDTGDATNNKTGKPINTRTGVYQYNTQDISIPTAVGILTFSRDYSSMGIAITSTLSPGWTHNQDTRLIMPTDPDGEEDVVLFKLHTSNLYTFTDNGDGTYTPAPGLLVTLIRQDGPPVQYTINDKDQNSYTFNDSGKLISYKNAQGYSLEYSYDTAGLLSQIIDSVSAKSLNFTYNILGKIVRVADQTGRDVNYTYDSNGDLIQVVDVLDQVWSYTYDSAHHMTNVLDPDYNSLERTEYDAQGRAVRQYDGENNLIVELTYNTDGTTTITDALGYSSINTYDERGTFVSNTDATGNADEKSYLSNFRPFSITDADGNSTNLSWS